MEKAAIYCRLSDEDKNKTNAADDSESIQNQKALLTRYAIEKGWSIYKIYSDDDYSGLDKDRPDFNKMIQDAKEGRFSIVLCKHQSRFTRDMELVEKYLHNKFMEWGIRFVSITDNADTYEKSNKKSRQINGLVNEWYCEDISEAIKATFKVKRETGKFIGSFASFGYEKDPKDKNKLVIDGEAAEIVKNIFKWYLEGYGTQHIAQMLNERKIPNPAVYKQSKGLNFKTSSKTGARGLWNKTTIRRILKNQVYIGCMVQGKRRKANYKSNKIISTPEAEWVTIENTHAWIIDTKTFQEVQRRTAGRVRSTGKGKAHIFASKVRCMDCGTIMNKVSNKNYTYLRCSRHAAGPGKRLCTGHSIRLDHLTGVITQKIREHINSYCSDNLVNRLQDRPQISFPVDCIKIQIEKTNKSIDDIWQAVKSMYMDKVKGLITEDQFCELNRSFLSEKQLLTDRKDSLEGQLRDWQGKFNTHDKLDEIITKYRDLKELTPAMVNNLIDYIEIGEKSKATGEQIIKIYWLF